MPIDFLQIPTTIRTPGSYVEFDNSRATGLLDLPQKMLILGQRLSTGETAKEVLVRVTSVDNADAQFGYGSMLARMCKAAISQNGYSELWAVASDDAGAAVAATGTLTFTGPATAAGTLSLMIGGVRVRLAVAKDDTADEVAAAVETAINAASELPVTASAALAVVTLTARNKGEVANYLDLRHSYYLGEKLPAGIGLAIVAMASGSANPDLTAAIAALADQQFHHIICPYTDTANLTVLETELEDRWGPLKQNEGWMYSAVSGTQATMSTFGGTRNEKLFSIQGTGKSPTPPEICAALYGATAAYYLNNDPARPLQTLRLKGMLPPAASEQLTQAERNILLWDGISTYMIDKSGDCFIERAITTYQTNALGIADPSYLNLNTIATLSWIREQVRARISQRYPRHKLADDNFRGAAGQAVVRPKDLRAELVALFAEMERAGMVENLNQFEQDLIVERNESDRSRVDARMSPDLVGQFHIFAGQVQYLL